MSATLKSMKKVGYSIYIHLLFGSLCLGGLIVTLILDFQFSLQVFQLSPDLFWLNG
jgi:hypothetical protein